MTPFLVTTISRHQVIALLPNEPVEAVQSRAVVAGILAAARELLTPSEFAALITACEIDRPSLSDLLALAAADPSSPSDLTTIDI